MTTVLVTGATDGLGRALARELVQAGDTVLIHGRDPQRGERALAETGAAALISPTSPGSATSARSPPSSRPSTSSSTTPASAARVRAPRARTGSSCASRSTISPASCSRGCSNRRAWSTSRAPARAARLRRPDAHARLQRLARVRAEQARADHARLRPRRGGRDANALHPATYMPTKMVLDAGVDPVSTLEQGLRATLKLVQRDDVSGRYFNGEREARADDQAYDPDARRACARSARATWARDLLHDDPRLPDALDLRARSGRGAGRGRPAHRGGRGFAARAYVGHGPARHARRSTCGSGCWRAPARFGGRRSPGPHPRARGSRGGGAERGPARRPGRADRRAGVRARAAGAAARGSARSTRSW